MSGFTPFQAGELGHAPLNQALTDVLSTSRTVALIWVRPEDFGAVGDGITDDKAAFLAAANALGIMGGDIRLRLGTRYRVSSLVLPDFVSIRGHIRPGLPSGASYNYNFNLIASTLVVDSGTAATGVTSADAPQFSVKLPFAPNPAGAAVGMPVTGPGVQPGTIVIGLATGLITLSVPLVGDCPSGSTISFGTLGITLGVSSYISETQIIKTGMVTPPVSASSAQTEINSWATGGCAVNANADSCGVVGCLIIGFNQCISLARGHRQVLTDVMMDGYNGLSMGSSGDYIMPERLRFEPLFTIQLAIATSTPLITYRPGTGFMIGQNSGDTTLHNCFSFCAGVGFWVQDSFRVSLAECFADGNTSYINGTTIAPIGFHIIGGSYQCKIKGRSSSMSYGVLVDLTTTPGGTSLDNGPCIIDMVNIGNLIADWQVNSGGMILQGCQSVNGLGTPVVAGPSCNHLEVWWPDFTHTHATGVVNAFNIDPAALPFTMRVGGKVQNYLDNLGSQFIGQHDRNGNYLVYATFNGISGAGLQFPQGFSTNTLTVGNDTLSGTVLEIDGVAGHSRQLLLESASSIRWNVNADGSAETGSNSGSSFRIDAYDDTGALLWNAMLVDRVDGHPRFAQGITIGPSSALATAATTGFLQIPFVAGAPTGVPNFANRGAAMVYDTTNHKLWAYDNPAGAWKGVVFT
jgi:hypothetical protein